MLRGQDLLAPTLVEMWAALASLHGAPVKKTEAALREAGLMRSWQDDHGAKWPD